MAYSLTANVSKSFQIRIEPALRKYLLKIKPNVISSEIKKGAIIQINSGKTLPYSNLCIANEIMVYSVLNN